LIVDDLDEPRVLESLYEGAGGPRRPTPDLLGELHDREDTLGGGDYRAMCAHGKIVGPAAMRQNHYV
jgi:hypothetical protein